jgi:hypothetical protein
MIDLLDEVIEIPFELFWHKFIEKGGLNIDKFKAGAIWFSMTIEQRESAFYNISNCLDLKELLVVCYLKLFI